MNIGSAASFLITARLLDLGRSVEHPGGVRLSLAVSGGLLLLAALVLVGSGGEREVARPAPPGGEP